MTNQYRFDPAAAARFSAERPTKTDLTRGKRLFLGLNCFEPGQSQPVHTHQEEDKFYLVLSGKASMVVGDQRFEAAPGALVWAPAGVPHGVEVAHERTVLLIGMAPPPR